MLLHKSFSLAKIIVYRKFLVYKFSWTLWSWGPTHVWRAQIHWEVRVNCPLPCCQWYSLLFEAICLLLWSSIAVFPSFCRTLVLVRAIKPCGCAFHAKRCACSEMLRSSHSSSLAKSLCVLCIPSHMYEVPKLKCPHFEPLLVFFVIDIKVYIAAVITTTDSSHILSYQLISIPDHITVLET